MGPLLLVIASIFVLALDLHSVWSSQSSPTLSSASGDVHIGETEIRMYLHKLSPEQDGREAYQILEGAPASSFIQVASSVLADSSFWFDLWRVKLTYELLRHHDAAQFDDGLTLLTTGLKNEALKYVCIGALASADSTHGQASSSALVAELRRRVSDERTSNLIVQSLANLQSYAANERDQLESMLSDASISEGLRSELHFALFQILGVEYFSARKLASDTLYQMGLLKALSATPQARVPWFVDSDSTMKKKIASAALGLFGSPSATVRQSANRWTTFFFAKTWPNLDASRIAGQYIDTAISLARRAQREDSVLAVRESAASALSIIQRTKEKQED